MVGETTNLRLGAKTRPLSTSSATDGSGLAAYRAAPWQGDRPGGGVRAKGGSGRNGGRGPAGEVRPSDAMLEQRGADLAAQWLSGRA